MPSDPRTPAEDAEPPIVEIQTGPDVTDTARVVVIGSRDSMRGAGRDILVVDSPYRSIAYAAAAAMLVTPVIPIVRLPDRPRQTKREWRERMKGR